MKTSPLSFLAFAALLVGCGGAGTVVRAGRFEGKYTGSYTVSDADAVDEAVVLDIDALGKAEGSVAVRGTVFDFNGRIAADGTLAAHGEGIDVQASLVHREGALTGSLVLSDGTSIRRARATFRAVPATE